MQFSATMRSKGDLRLPLARLHTAALLALCLWISAAVCTPAGAVSEAEFLDVGVCDRLPSSNSSDYFHANSVFYDPTGNESLWSEIVYTVLQWTHMGPKAPVTEMAASPGMPGRQADAAPPVRHSVTFAPASAEQPARRAGGGGGRPVLSGTPEALGQPGGGARPANAPASLSPGPAAAMQPGPPVAIAAVPLSLPRIDGAAAYPAAAPGGWYGGGATGLANAWSPSIVTPGLQNDPSAASSGPRSDSMAGSGTVPGGGVTGGGAPAEGRPFVGELLQSFLTSVSPGARTNTFAPVVPVLLPPPSAAPRPSTGGGTHGGTTGSGTGGSGSNSATSPISGAPIGGNPIGGGPGGTTSPMTGAPTSGTSSGSGNGSSAATPVANAPVSGGSNAANEGLVTPQAVTTIFNESFNEGTHASTYVPTGWQEKSYGSSGYAYSSTGGVTNGYARLTSAGTNSATSLFYTAGAFDASAPWTLTASIYIGGGTGADGLTFTWIDAKTLPALSNLAPDSGQGGGMMGLYSTGSAYIKQGYAFEFDTYYNAGSPQNDPNFTVGSGQQYQYTDLVAINDTGNASTTTWTHQAGTAHNFTGTDATTFPGNATWDAVELDYLGNGKFVFKSSYITGGSYSFTVANYNPSNKDYFGFTASTGSMTDVHRVDNLVLTGSTPEPRSTAIILCGGLMLVGSTLRRYRKQKANVK